MTFQATDTLPQHHATATTTKVLSPVVHTGRKTPAQVLEALPDSATPWQQDSAIQAYFRPGENNHYSTQPDTLGLPGRKADVSQISLPSGVWKDPSVLHKALHKDTPFDSVVASVPAHPGYQADPQPAIPAKDPLVTCILLGGFILMVAAFSRSRTFFLKQTRGFFYTSKARTTQMAEHPHEVWYQALLTFITMFLAGVGVYCGIVHNINNNQVSVTSHSILGTCILAVLIWFIFRSLLLWGVNWVFFTSKKNLQWLRDCMLLTGCMGAVMLPMLLLHIYGPVSWQICAIYLIIVVILAEILFIYKSFVTFFNRIGDFLQIILYFCALELMPLAGLAGFIALYYDNLRTIF